MSKQMKLFLAVALLLGLVFGADAMAGTGGTEFGSIYDLLKNWATGTLGKIFALGIFIVGIAAGIIKGDLMAAVSGVGGAMIMYYGPAVIEGIVSALI
jgi:conjugal transfer pilus assembly protein TraA